MTALGTLWDANSGHVVFTEFLLILQQQLWSQHKFLQHPQGWRFYFYFFSFLLQLPCVFISALDDNLFFVSLPQIMYFFPVGEVAGWIQADFQQWLTSFSSQTTEEAFPRSQIFPVSTGWNLWKKILQEDTTLHTSTAPGCSHSHGSPHLISINLLQILAKSFHQHMQCLSQVGKFLGPVSPCRHFPISYFKLLGCLMRSVLWWAQQKSLICSFLVFLSCRGVVMPALYITDLKPAVLQCQ